MMMTLLLVARPEYSSPVRCWTLDHTVPIVWFPPTRHITKGQRAKKEEIHES